MKPYLLFSKPYYNQEEGANPRSGATYELCQNVRTSPYNIPRKALQEYADKLPQKCVLVPIPGHVGTPTYTHQLCCRLKASTAVSKEIAIIEALVCEPHPSLCELKRRGEDVSDINVHMMVNPMFNIPENMLRLSKKGFDIILVDNVLDTGKTLTAAAKALDYGLEIKDCKVITIGYTGNDEGIYNPFKMLDELRAKAQETYDLAYVDYRDEFNAKDIEACLKDKSLQPIYERGYWDDGVFSAAKQEARELVENSDFDEEDQERFLDDEEFILLTQEIEERNQSSPEEKAFMQTRAHGRLSIHSDYDCWVPPYDAGALYSKDNLLWGLMAELSLNPKKVKEEVIRSGWHCGIEGTWPDIKSRNGKEVISYRDFVNVLYECPNYGIWTFFGVFDMKALLDDNFDTDAMLIPKGTTCTMYNSWNGGGSCAFAKTLRDITVKELIRRAAPYQDGVRIYVDEKGCGSGYASNEVYGGHPSDDIFLK